MVAAVAVLGTLLVIAEVINTPTGVSIGWALWFVLACSVFQALPRWPRCCWMRASSPRPRPGPSTTPTASTGNTASTDSTAAASSRRAAATTRAPVSSSPPAHPAYGSQYGGYSSASQAPTQNAIPTRPPAASPPSLGRGSPAAHQQGPSTPPTGFPSFSPPPPVGAGTGSQGGSAHGRLLQSARGQQSFGQDQQSSPPSGPAPV